MRENTQIYTLSTKSTTNGEAPRVPEWGEPFLLVNNQKILHIIVSSLPSEPQLGHKISFQSYPSWAYVRIARTSGLDMCPHS